MSNIFDDLPSFSDVQGNSFYLINYFKPNKLYVWDKAKSQDGAYSTMCRLIDIASIPQEELAKLNIWKEMPEEIKENMKSAKELESIQVHSLMEKARKGRRAKYPGIPKTLTCCECSEVINVQPSVIMKRAEKLGVLVDVYIKSYKCQSCCPTKGKGRKSNPEFSDLPKEMVCKCGKKAIVNITYLKAKADKLGVTIQKLIENFKCQSCCPTKGRHKK